MSSFIHLVNKYLLNTSHVPVWSWAGHWGTVVNKKEVVPFPQEIHRMVGKTSTLVRNQSDLV